MPSLYTGISDASENKATVSGGALLVSTGAGATASSVKITDGTNVVGVVPGGAGNGPELSVSTGFITAVTTLAAVTANATGTTVDAGASQANWCGIALAAATPTAGTLTLELSMDNVTWASSSATASITAAGNYLVASTGRAARYARCSLTGLTGTITLTVKMMAAD